MKILVVVPAYNEEGCIRGVIEDIREHFPDGDIIVINDGSQDNTSAIAGSLGTRVADLPYNLGIGGAMQAGFLYALQEGYDAVIQFDGDGQHHADQIGKILAPWRSQEADLVVGSRFLSDSGFTSSVQRKIGAKILSFVVSSLTGQRITDTTSGFRVYGRTTLEFFCSVYPEDYPEVEALILAHKKGLKIVEVASEIGPRTGGRSSITSSRAFYYMIKVLLAIFVDLMKKID
ncbi:MAG: glycosyltransferase family 2 protein [Nitrospirae bacterium]|nr:glycosyltransferase family 2 protein [Nitrospirota bacterium]